MHYYHWPNPHNPALVRSAQGLALVRLVQGLALVRLVQGLAFVLVRTPLFVDSFLYRLFGS